MWRKACNIGGFPVDHEDFTIAVDGNHTVTRIVQNNLKQFGPPPFLQGKVIGSLGFYQGLIDRFLTGADAHDRKTQLTGNDRRRYAAYDGADTLVAHAH